MEFCVFQNNKRHIYEKLSMRNDSALGLKPQYLVALDFTSIYAGVNIIHTFINPDIYVGGENRLKLFALAQRKGIHPYN
jgi:hypothetical protein